SRGTIEWRTVILEDIPVLSGVSALGYQAGDPVILLGWDAAGHKGAMAWFILGRLGIPGIDSPDVVIRGASIIIERGDMEIRSGGTLTVDGDTAIGGDLAISGDT